MAVYSRQIATALRLIAKYGQQATWERRAPGGGTAAKPATSVVVSRTVKIAFLPLDREYLQTTLGKGDGSDIASGMLTGYMGQVDFVPTLKDTVVRNVNGVDERYSITDRNGIEVIDPNGEGAILYIVRFVR